QTDAVVADEFSKDANYKTVGVGAIEAGWMGLDIGPESRSTYEEIISNSNLIVWNGPMGVFEMEQFANGTKSVANALSRTKGDSIIGEEIQQQQFISFLYQNKWIIFHLAVAHHV